MHRTVTMFHLFGQVFYRAHVWIDGRYSTKTFSTVAGAENYVPAKPKGD